MLVAFGHEQVKALANKTGETAHPAVRKGKQALLIDHHAVSHQILVVSGRAAEFMPYDCGAHSKALLGDCGIAELRAIFGDSRFQAYTPRTIVSIEKMGQACAEIKADGAPHDHREYVENARSMAAPIRDNDGTVVTAIGISAPLTRSPRQREAVLARQLSAAASEASAVLGAEGHQSHLRSRGA
jgi:IclR family acetate operon transcriptional repressor